MQPEQIRREAQQLLQAKALPQALGRFEELVSLAPDDSSLWNAYGKALLAAKRPNEAIEAMARACNLDPDDIGSRVFLGFTCQNHSRVAEAIHWHGEALALDPGSLVLRLNHAFLWPVVPESHQQIHDCRQRCLELFEAIEREPELHLDPTHGVGNHCFGLAYHGSDDRALLESYAAVVRRHVRRGIDAPVSRAGRERSAGSRPRLGFLSAFFYSHSNGRAFEGLLRGLNRERFELVLIHMSASQEDAVRRRLEASVDRVAHCPADIGGIWQLLNDLQLDLLFITDVGMNPEVPALLARRCAPVQVTGWGFPRTSGFQTLDYYLSGDLVEPPQAQDHYSETLIRLTGLPCRYLSEDLSEDPLAAAIGRAYFLLPEEPPLVGCLQTFWKLHPDFDAVLERIAVRAPEAWFVFIEPNPPELAEVFLERLRRSAPTASERLVVVAAVTRSQYSVLASCLDLMLDTLHFGSGISFYESISSGTPMVTMEGPFLRSRYVAGGYRMMGLQQPPVTSSPEAMADLVVDLLRDRPRLERLRREIKAAAPRLYDGMEMVHSFEDFAIEAIARARHRVPTP